jgi:hypothetical protein
MTGSVGAGSISVAIGTPLSAATFTNSSLASTTPLAISNTTAGAGAPAGELAVTFTGASSPLSAATNLDVWTASDASECDESTAPGADAVAGTWASGVTLTIVQLAPGATQTVCVRSMVNTRQDAASSSGSQSFTASVSARLALHAFSAESSSASTVGASRIYPFSTLGDFCYTFRPSSDLGRCLDVTGGYAAAPGTVLGTFACHTSSGPTYANQWFTLAAVSGSLVGIRNAGTSNLYVTANTDGTVTMEVRNESNPLQSWEPQSRASGVFQFVNDATGLCLSAINAPGPVGVESCDGSARQAFTSTQLDVAPPTGQEGPP